MTRRYGTTVLLLTAVAALLTVAAACSDEEETAPTATPRGTATPGATGTAPSSPAARQYATPPALAIDAQKSYVAVLETDKGVIRIKLLPDIAPQTVNSFVFLARDHFYDGVTFHRVLPGFVAQTGDPTGSGSGGPGYKVPAEFTTSVPYTRGVVGMARSSDPNSGGSQWFVTYGDASNLNGAYTVFGVVTQGMDVVDCLAPRDPSRNPGAPPGDAIITIEIQES